MTKEELAIKVDELVWNAWMSGRAAGSSMTSPRQADEMHAEIWRQQMALEKEILTFGE